MRRLPLCLLFFTLAASSASAVDLSVVGAIDFAGARSGTPLGAPSVSYSPKGSFGGGILLTANANPLINLETGVLYVPRKTSTGTSSDETLTMLEVPLVLRVTFPFLSVAGGVYYARGLGNVTVTQGASSIDQTYDASFLNQNDFGLTASVGFNLPIAPKISIILDARFLFGLANLDSRPTYTYSLWDVMGLAGARFSF